MKNASLGVSDTIDMSQTLLVEAGWEVCWQLGGIYTVLKTKAPVMVNEWADRYCLLGPYHAASAGIEFEAQPRTGPFGEACDLLESEWGVKVHFGRWLIEGLPQVVLIDYSQHRDRIEKYKYLFWKDHQIRLESEADVDDCILFGYLAADFLEMLCRVVKGRGAATRLSGGKTLALPILAHFHEWMAAVPIPILGKRKLPVSTVFTTHATILGRYLAADDQQDFYGKLSSFDPYAEAGRRKIYPKFAIERAAAWGATCFTTISEITGAESEHLLGKKPDVLLPNGISSKRFAAVHEFQNLHLIYKKRIQDFLMGHFFTRSSFDLNKTLHLFTAGRFEHRNKGLDLFIESLARLNWRLKSKKKDVTIVAFIVTRAKTNGFNVHVLKNQMLFKDMRKYCEDLASGVASKLLSAAANGKNPKQMELFDDNDLHTLKRLTYAWKQTHPLPNVATHNLEVEAEDPIMNQLRVSGLVNRPEDPVKVVYHPDFLSAASPVLGLDYEQFVRGCHLGVFPSYYEPWGYTPEECAALGIPSITSDLAGFGTFVRRNVPNHESKGLLVLDRRYRSFHESADQLTDMMFRLVNQTMRERIELRNRVEVESANFDWSVLIPAYREAHRIALQRSAGGLKRRSAA